MAVATTDALHAWAVGLDGAIVATSNGSTWGPQSSATTQDLNAVAFPDPSHGWAVGDGGVVRVTANGGAVWGGQVSGTTADITCVTFPEGDAAHGWVVARDDSANTSSIIATDNGGGAWAEQLAVAGEITSISFPDALHGWAVTFNGVLYSTSDGGDTWGHRSVTGSDDHPGGIVFVDATHGWMTGGTETEPWGTYIWATADGGVSWALQNKGGGPERGVDAIAFPDLLHGYVVGESGSVMRTRRRQAAGHAQALRSAQRVAAAGSSRDRLRKGDARARGRGPRDGHGAAQAGCALGGCRLVGAQPDAGRRVRVEVPARCDGHVPDAGQRARDGGSPGGADDVEELLGEMSCGAPAGQVRAGRAAATRRRRAAPR